MRQPRIEAVGARARQRLAVTWADGSGSVVDLAPAIRQVEGLAPLEDPKRFARAAVADWGWAVAWGDDVAVAARTLWRLAREQAGEAMPAEDFRRWREQLGLTQASAAAALGLSLRMVKYYESGTRLVPKTVRLACAGYAAERAA